MMKLTREELSQAVKMTVDLYTKLKENPGYTDFYEENPEALTVENIAEDILDNDMDISFTVEDLNEVINLSKNLLK